MVTMAHITGTRSPGQAALSSPAVDEQRARELYKYFRPLPTPPESPDTVLTAYAQLVAWRLNAQRAMISLIDDDVQYFVAEGTKTLHLDNVLRCDHPDDALWAGCIKVPKAGRLCEHTIAMPQPVDGGPAYFEVLDLAADARFNTLDFVAGPPYFKHYVGVPLRTRKGINIGSLFVLNTNHHPPLTDTQRHFLGVVAANIMQHLEMTRDKKDNQRSAHMTACLSAYIDPYRRRLSHERRSDSCSDLHQTTTPTTPVQMADGLERGKIYTRAAEALRDAMAMEQHGGGIVFFDTLAAMDSDQFCPECPNSGLEPPHITENTAQCKVPHINQTPRAARLAVAHVLAHTSSDEPIANPPTTSHKPCFLPLSTENLSKLVEHHPRGNMFTFDKHGQMDSDSSSDDQGPPDAPFKRYEIHRTVATKEDAHMLRTHFPMAHQIIFIPLWDSMTSRYTACFVYNNSPYRYFSHKLEFLHSITLVNCLIAEIARSANQLISQQKSDFMGSISHELRSPLHGILASCELLADTRVTSFQQSLLHTADSCAKTLLDIVNMVLDYSRINKSEQSLDNIQGTTRNPSGKGHQSPIQSSLSARRNFNLAVLVEDVVEGVATGYAYEKALSAEHDLTHVNTGNGELGSNPNISSREAKVDLIVDISKEDWIYWSEPGAIRRIVMNLVGNSLKYTPSGFVHVQLATQKSTLSSDSKHSSCVVLTITDTGQGISPAFLENKLFTPFAQESNLSPGTGLGLSLVKLLVDKLDGTISVHSSVGVGTRIAVKIPMVRNTPAESHCIDSRVNADLGSIIERKGVDIVNTNKAHANEKTITIVRNHSAGAIGSQNQTSSLLHDTMAKYLGDWLGFNVCEWHEKLHPDIIIIDEAELYHLINTNPHLFASGCRTIILVMYDITSAHNFKDGAITGHANVEYMRHPLGPNKLAKALNSCLERQTADNSGPVVAEVPQRHSTGQATQSLMETTMPPVRSELNGVRDIGIGLVTPDQEQVDLPTVDASHHSMIQASTMKNSSAHSIVAISHFKPRSIVSIMPVEQEAFDSTGTHLDSSCAVGAQELETCTNSTKRLPRMLLVDDNKINLKILQVCMRKRKYVTVNSAEDGLQAVTTYRRLLHSTPSAPPDIVLMDISMPVLDGVEATRQIRALEAEYNKEKLPPGAPPRTALIIAVTGLAGVRDQKAAFSAGVDMYMMKPVSVATLSQLLASWEASGKDAVLLRDAPPLRGGQDVVVAKP